MLEYVASKGELVTTLRVTTKEKPKEKETTKPKETFTYTKMRDPPKNINDFRIYQQGYNKI